MTDASTPPALATVLAYHQAWTSHHLDQAMTYIADDITCDAPGARICGAGQYRDFLGGFMTQLTDVQTVAAFGGESTAVLFYSRTPPTSATHLPPSASPSPTGRSAAACSCSTGPRSPRRNAEHAGPWPAW